MGKRLAIIATHPVQYQVPIWRALAGVEGLDVHVYYASDFSVRGYMDQEFGVAFKWDVPLTEGYAHTFLSTDQRVRNSGGFFSLRPEGLHRHLLEFKPDCVLITAYFPFFWWETILVLKRLKIPILIRAETTDVALRRGFLKRVFRNAFLGLVYGSCSKFLAIGRYAREHYLAHGVTDGRIGWSPYCVDTTLFQEQIRLYAWQRNALRQSMGFSSSHTVFLFSGKLIDKKGPMTIARALQAMQKSDRDKMGLIVVGDGVLRPEFEAACRELLGARSVFVGFVNQSCLGENYAAADCLLLPSNFGETWGLVVNEAMQFGLPAIVSDRVGCHPDLVREGETGYVFPVGDSERLKALMLRFIETDPARREAMAAHCRATISSYSVAEAAEGIRKAVFSCNQKGDPC